MSDNIWDILEVLSGALFGVIGAIITISQFNKTEKKTTSEKITTNTNKIESITKELGEIMGKIEDLEEKLEAVNTLENEINLALKLNGQKIDTLTDSIQSMLLKQETIFLELNQSKNEINIIKHELKL